MSVFPAVAHHPMNEWRVSAIPDLPHLAIRICTLSGRKGSIDPRPFHQDQRYRLMASDRKTVEFLVEQMAGGGTVTAKAMFGEFGIYCDGKMVALVCDDHLFVKSTVGGRAFAAGAEEAPPYPGAKPCLLIDAEQWDDSEWLAEIVRITFQELPAPKVRAKRKSA
ncbi:TfoX/Sxy family protein [Novosphingobium aerophilum]|uniref:TfoX/Sxy family protein n=1 Tax=Novosphingobium aerophilum TaxID=2839843 RepID=UPI003FCEFBDC